LQNLGKITSWARDTNSRDRDEMLVRLETIWRPRPHPCKEYICFKICYSL